MTAMLKTGLEGPVLLTGASGFIGGRLRDALLDIGTDVVSLVRPESPPATRGRSVAADYGRPATVRDAIAAVRPRYVVHLAGATKGVTYADFQRGNVMPTRALLEAIVHTQTPLSRFVHVSSLTAYGPSNEGPPKREQDAREPVEHYGRSKLEAERTVESFSGRVPWTMLRPSGVYGPGEGDYFALFKAAHQRVNLFFGNEKKRMSVVYVDDVVRAIVDAARHENTVDRGYFLCDGVPTNWEDFQAHILRAVGRRALRVNLPSFLVPAAASVGELMSAVDKKPRLMNRQRVLMDAQVAWLCSHDAARADFGYIPQVQAGEGTARTYAWYREQRWL
jgi:UDP-glucose 4-epimerase